MLWFFPKVRPEQVFRPEIFRMFFFFIWSESFPSSDLNVYYCKWAAPRTSFLIWKSNTQTRWVIQKIPIEFWFWVWWREHTLPSIPRGTQHIPVGRMHGAATGTLESKQVAGRLEGRPEFEVSQNWWWIYKLFSPVFPGLNSVQFETWKWTPGHGGRNSRRSLCFWFQKWERERLALRGSHVNLPFVLHFLLTPPYKWPYDCGHSSGGHRSLPKPNPKGRAPSLCLL